MSIYLAQTCCHFGERVSADGGGKGGAAGGPGGDSNFETSNFATEYAKSSRSKCRGCDDKILKVTYISEY